MSTRRVLLVVVALLLVVIIAASAGLAGVLLLRRPAISQGQLLVLGANSRLLLFDAAGSERLLAEDSSSDGFHYPIASPDGRQVAYISNGEEGTALVALDLGSGERKLLYSRPETLPLFYMAWAPDGSQISFLTNLPQGGLGIHVVPSDGSTPATLVSPNHTQAYFAWTPDSKMLLLHLNGSVFEEGRMATFTLGSETPRPIDGDPGFFQAPAWSADGSQLFYVAQPPVDNARPSLADVVSVLTRAAPDGSGATELVREDGSVLFFSRAPGSDEIAYTTLSFEGRSFGPLRVVDGRSGTSRVVSRENDHVAAFFWSPDGKQLAYLTREEDGDPSTRHTWHLASSGGGEVRDLASFTPAGAFVGLVSFFDAYALTLNIWSPDSRRLTYAAEDGVYVLDTATGDTKRMAEGALGIWVE